ncbi:hypothetical protein [Haloferula sp. BvORR071]|uniref:hypothetical protein n=1 Tax=Haloferula sp. BvORR071 TaxID=1396141 RepID=UPI000B23EBAC|nr:hypothetical protein [Haloferula sp. BvORR071]
MLNEIRSARFAFQSSDLGKGAATLEGELKGMLSAADWEKVSIGLRKKAEETVGDPGDFNRETAREWLQGVKDQAKGQMAEGIRNTLLASNPAFVDSPGAELAAGWRQDFKTVKHPKADGADITIGFPLCWTKRESSRPNFVQVFRSGAGHGPLMSIISCKKALGDGEAGPTPEELKEVFVPAFFKELLPPGAKEIESRAMKIANQPGWMMVYDSEEETLDIKVRQRMTAFYVFHKKHLITISFSILEPSLKKGMDFDAAQKAYFPTYRTIVGTLVLN